MTTPAEKQNRAAKRGCLWLLIGTPSLLLIYLFLLSTSFFDSKPVSYPDLEIQPEGKTIPLLEALESSPEWAAWLTLEASREAWLSDAESEAPFLPLTDVADSLAPELARAIALATWLCEKPELLGPKPWPQDISAFEISFEDASGLRRIFATLRAAPFIAAHSSHERDRLIQASPLALRLLAKSRAVGDQLIGRLVWLISESSSHELLAADIRRALETEDAEQLRLFLSSLDACRPGDDQAMANAWKSEFRFACKMMVYVKRQLWNFGSGVTAFGSSTSFSNNLLEQWTVLRVQPNKCAAILAEETRIRLRNSSVPARDRVWPAPDANRFTKAISPAPNAGGEVLLDLGSSSYEKAPQVEDHGLARHHLLRLLIGLALYRIDHGNQLPADLGALVPAYLPEIPKDPYTGEPPLYDPAAGKLAFRGMDFVASSAPVDTEKEARSRRRGLPPGVAGLFEREGRHDPGVDLKAFFGAVEKPEP
jgi:hypothetical protein